MSKAANSIRRRLEWCGWIPATLPDSKNFLSPLCRNDWITSQVYHVAHYATRCESGLESAARDTALSDDGLQRADSDFGMIRNWDCCGSTIDTPLHDHMTASLPNDLEAMLFKDAAHIQAGKDTELTHAPLQNG